MRCIRLWLTAALCASPSLVCATQAWAHGPLTGGAAAPAGSPASAAPQSSPRLTGGSPYGALAAVSVKRPVVTQLIVPATAAPGSPPPVLLRIDEAGVGTVQARVMIHELSSRALVLVVNLGWVRVGRALQVPWPRGARLSPGSYHVSVTAHDHHSGALLRLAHSSGVATLTVLAPAPPAPQVPETAPLAGALTPAQSAAAGAVFPVAGPHSFGGPENRFGAPRNGYTHQGQDILAAEGTAILAPLSGIIVQTAYQAGGAGYYAVEHTGYGLDFMFAHCRAGSVTVSAEQSVSAGAQLCQAGQTGDATTPHLHFEIWMGGWQAAGGRPIDPLPYLQAWEH